jgi:hypothetical protein
MEGDIVFAHGEAIEMFEALCELICVSMSWDEAYCFLIVDALVEG